MVIRVCTGWHPAGRAAYGDNFLASFDKWWPADVELQAYVEEPHPMPRDACRELWAIEGAREFVERHKDDKRVSGNEPTENWRRKDHRKGYSFRFDAMKFFKQIIIPQAAAEGLVDGDILIWMDGDVETTSRPAVDWIREIHQKHDVSFLQRDGTHSEIGFWSLKISDQGRQFLSSLADCYLKDEFLELTEWHSAFVWDSVRRRYPFKEKHLAAAGRRGHVWPYSPLAAWSDHKKGKRKPAS